MKILLFAITNFLAIVLFAAARVVVIGAIDPHFGYFGSIIKAIPSSAVSAVVTAIAFGIGSMVFKGARTALRNALIGGVTGLLSYGLAWILSDQLQDVHMLAIFLPFAVCGFAASLLSRCRNG